MDFHDAEHLLWRLSLLPRLEPLLYQPAGEAMSDVVDLSFVDRLPEILARRQHYADVVREALRRKIELVQDDCDEAVDRARDLMKAGGDITDELKALEEYATSLGLVVALLRREAEKASAVRT